MLGETESQRQIYRDRDRERQRYRDREANRGRQRETKTERDRERRGYSAVPHCTVSNTPYFETPDVRRLFPHTILDLRIPCGGGCGFTFVLVPFVT